jgi:hypothetical protein
MIAQQLCCGPVAVGTRTEPEKNLTRLISARREVGLLRGPDAIDPGLRK